MDIRTMHKIEDLIWKDVLQEDCKNFTPRFKHNLRIVIHEIERIIINKEVDLQMEEMEKSTGGGYY